MWHTLLWGCAHTLWDILDACKLNVMKCKGYLFVWNAYLFAISMLKSSWTRQYFRLALFISIASMPQHQCDVYRASGTHMTFPFPFWNSDFFINFNEKRSSTQYGFLTDGSFDHFKALLSYITQVHQTMRYESWRHMPRFDSQVSQLHHLQLKISS